MITIDEAILIIGNEVRVAEVNDRPLEVKAFELGIEALKRIKEERVYHFSQGLIGINRLLQGETEK